jgi:hypothetical protein
VRSSIRTAAAGAFPHPEWSKPIMSDSLSSADRRKLAALLKGRDDGSQLLLAVGLLEQMSDGAK